MEYTDAEPLLAEADCLTLEDAAGANGEPPIWGPTLVVVRSARTRERLAANLFVSDDRAVDGIANDRYELGGWLIPEFRQRSPGPYIDKA